MRKKQDAGKTLAQKAKESVEADKQNGKQPKPLVKTGTEQASQGRPKGSTKQAKAEGGKRGPKPKPPTLAWQIQIGIGVTTALQVFDASSNRNLIGAFDFTSRGLFWRPCHARDGILWGLWHRRWLGRRGKPKEHTAHIGLLKKTYITYRILSPTGALLCTLRLSETGVSKMPHDATEFPPEIPWKELPTIVPLFANR